LTGRYACYDTYVARDGKWLAIGAIEPRFFANLCKALGCEQWTARQLEEGVQDEMRADFQAALATRDRDDWVAELAPSDACVSPVYDVAELARDPQFRARGAFSRAAHPSEGEFEQLAPPFAGMTRSDAVVLVRDNVVTDTESLLADAGLSADQIERMRADGVIA
jgi:crotonobetainyl-CoA:carnitine CoA-transferase CaiB-like acyl-CoA transferase